MVVQITLTVLEDFKLILHPLVKWFYLRKHQLNLEIFLSIWCKSESWFCPYWLCLGWCIHGTLILLKIKYRNSKKKKSLRLVASEIAEGTCHQTWQPRLFFLKVIIWSPQKQEYTHNKYTHVILKINKNSFFFFPFLCLSACVYVQSKYVYTLATYTYICVFACLCTCTI